MILLLLKLYNKLVSLKIFGSNPNFRFLHVSTDEVYGSLGKDGEFVEEPPYDPRSPYSASKASSDHLVNSWIKTYSFPAIITHCTNNFGPWQESKKLEKTR